MDSPNTRHGTLKNQVARYLEEVVHPFEDDECKVKVVGIREGDLTCDVWYYVGEQPMGRKLNYKIVRDYCDAISPEEGEVMRAAFLELKARGYTNSQIASYLFDTLSQKTKDEVWERVKDLQNSETVEKLLKRVKITKFRSN